MNKKLEDKYFLEKMMAKQSKPYKPRYPRRLKEIVDYPHYSHPKFDGKPITLWGYKELNPSKYEYSDRLSQWDREKYSAASKKATEEIGNNNTAEYFQKFLCYYFDVEVILKHILGGVNHSNGYGYYVFGFDIKEPKKKKNGKFVPKET